MSIDKRKCRKYADPGLRMSRRNGLLHAGQIKYIVRAAVRLIGGKRILVLYVYLREEAEGGSFRPLWSVFQGKDDFATLARREDGSLSWRMAAFDELDGRWAFADRCAFYTPKDEECVRRFFRDSKAVGFKPLTSAQRKIQQRRKLERKRRQEREILDRMKALPPLPRGLEKWVHRNIMPAYFFYDYKRGRKEVEGICSACGKEVVIAGARNNAAGVCPGCGHAVTMKARGRRGCLSDRETLQVVQKTGPEEVVVRIVKCCYTYRWQDEPEKRIYENARLFVTTGREGDARIDSYYDSYQDYCLTGWRKGERHLFRPWQYSFEADQCGYLYCGNLPDALKGTPWQYCPVEAFYEHYRKQMEVVLLLSAHASHPRLEHLVKAGFWELASSLVYGRVRARLLDETQNRTHRVIQVAAEDVPFLRSLDPPPFVLAAFQEYCRRNLKERQKLLLWQIGNDVWRHIPQILEHMTPHKMVRYMEEQYSFLRLRKTKQGGIRYSSMQDLVGEYRDYLDMCARLEYDMKNSFVLYPKDLQKSHDRTARRAKHKADVKMRCDFRAVCSEIVQQVEFEMDGMKIVCPTVPDEVIAEGHALHHCVGGYVDRVAKRECIILFLRRCSEEKKPFYTIEVHDRRVVQVRGMKNCRATPEVNRFMERWEKEVLEASAWEIAA